MNTTDIMKDELFAPILFAIESRIHSSNVAAKSAGIDFNDSQIRSTLNKVRKSSEGNAPKIPNESPRDQALTALHHELLQLRTQFQFQESEGNQNPLPTREWCLCLRTVEDSIQRYSSGSGSQAYLAFIAGFIAKASKKNPIM
jgi:hypothetical protein